MYKKKCGCCPKFKRGDNSTYTFTKSGQGAMYLVSATPTKLLIESTPLSDTPRLQYYDAETLPKYRYISKLINSPSKF
jgi:hypothetical protein